MSTSTTLPLCVQCHQKPGVASYKPFCSKRCADIDLGAWLGEKYVVPSTTPENPEDAQILQEPQLMAPDTLNKL